MAHAASPHAVPPAAASPAGYDAEPRWPATLAVVAVGGLYLALPPSLTVAPPWLLLAVVLVLLATVLAAHRAGRHALNEWLGDGLLGIVTSALVGDSCGSSSPCRCTASRRPRRCAPRSRSGWRTCSSSRRGTGGSTRAGRSSGTGAAHWSPRFVDYRLLAFTTSTAFSPTDSPLLSRSAKGLVMLQAVVSFTTIAVLAARAVNIP